MHFLLVGGRSTPLRPEQVEGFGLPISPHQSRRGLLYLVELPERDVIVSRVKPLPGEEAAWLRLHADTVSRRHCRLRYDRGLYLGDDIGSSGGTFFNGEKARHFGPLRSGDVIEIGAFQATFLETRAGGPPD